MNKYIHRIMKRLAVFGTLVVACICAASAQTTDKAKNERIDSLSVNNSFTEANPMVFEAETNGLSLTPSQPLVAKGEEAMPVSSAVLDSLTYASRFGKPTLFTLFRPWSYFGYGLWDVHSGLNAQIDMGVSVGFGKNNPFKGASFYSNLSMLYAKEIGKRWTVAAGATLSRFKLWNENVNTFSVEAMGAYRINDKLTALIYGSHSFGNLGKSLYLPPYMGYGKGATNIGAELNVKVNESFSFQIGVSHTSYGSDNQRIIP